MLKLKQIILRYMTILALILVVLIVVSGLLIQLISSKNNMISTSDKIFDQIENVLENNRQQLLQTQEEYQKASFRKADAVASMIDHSEEFLKDLEDLSKNIDSIRAQKGSYKLSARERPLLERLNNICNIVEIDEVNIFCPFEENGEKNAVIISGTVAGFIGYDLNENDQTKYFRQMLEYNKVDRLYQDISENVASGELMQYSMVWSMDRKYMIEIGIKPSTIQNLLHSYELSTVFGLFCTGNDLLYAINGQTGKILGSNDPSKASVQQSYKDIGINDLISQTRRQTFTSYIDEEEYMCRMRSFGENFIVRMVAKSELYENILLNELFLFLGVGFVTAIIITSGLWYTDRYVIKSLQNINGTLREITNGNLEENINIRSSLEFSEFSDHINAMVASLLSSTDMMSFVLDKSDLRIAVYEYNDSMKRVRYTQNLPEILRLDGKRTKELTDDTALFRDFISGILKNRIGSDQNMGVYCLPGTDDEATSSVYLKIEESQRDNSMIGVVVDVTENVLERRKLEKERDIDVLTGMYNRRAFERRMDGLFKNYRELGMGVMIMFDADGLKAVNDRFGHENGDLYLIKMAEVIKEFAGEYTVYGRVGGDEFMMFLYHFDKTEQIDAVIDRLYELQRNTLVTMTSGETVQLRFSFGHVLSKGYSDYNVLEKISDGLMYKNKKNRKDTKIQ